MTIPENQRLLGVVTGMLIASFREADPKAQEAMLHDQIEQLHLMGCFAHPGVLSALAAGFMEEVSSATKKENICEHCQKAARLLAEYLDTVEVNNVFHKERASRENP